MSSPPPIPPRDSRGVTPPPVPGTKEAGQVYRAAEGRRKGVLIAIVAVVASVVLVLGLIVAFAAFYGFTAKDFEVNDAVRACVLTAADAGEWFEMDVKPELEEWDAEQYIDRSVQLYYYYNDEEESVYLNCNLTEEPKRSDAVMSYQIEWNGLKLTNRFGPGSTIGLEEADEVFRWGDESKFAFQILEGERYGFAFVTRKGGKVFFLDCWGLLLEDPEEIADFITPHLEQLDSISLMDEAARES